MERAINRIDREIGAGHGHRVRVCMYCVALCYVVTWFVLSCWCGIGDEGGAVVDPDLHGHHLRGLLGARRFR